jgi:hypothetical protein
MKTSAILATLALLGVHPALVGAQQLVLDDSLRGSTSGSQNGGSFSADGWRVTNKNDSITWHIPTVSQGAVEFSVRGLRPNDTRPEGADKNEIFHMYDWTYNNADTVYDGYRNNPYKHFVRKTNGDVGKIDSLELVWAITPNYEEPDTPILSWDPNTTYRFREEWGPDGAGNSVIRTYRDGTLLMTMAVPGTWNPAGHAIRIAASTRAPLYPDFGACVDAVYSDLQVWTGGAAPPPPPPQAGPVSVGISGDRFTVNGTPTFLLGVSYFDASNWTLADLDGLAARRFNLIRIWLDWGLAGDGRSFFDGSGALVQGAKLLSLVRAANARGLVVDVTILDPGLTFSDTSRALGEASNLLRDEQNVFFDVMNEHDHPGGPRTHAEIATFISIVRTNAPSRPVTVSGGGDHLMDADNINEEIAAGVMFLTPHFGRTSDWYDRTDERVAFVKGVIGARNLPVYLQEEARRGHSGLNPTKEQFIQAAREARDAGAAGWIFHTDAGFEMGAASFFNALDPVEIDTVNSLADAIFGPGAPPGGGGGGSGPLRGEYFDNLDFTGTRVVRNDATIEFDWGTGSPVGGIGPDTFSVRWTGWIRAATSETYTFTTESDDGVRLWVNGQLLVDNWTDHAPVRNSGTIALQAGRYYELKLEYYENGVGALIRLFWSSASQPEQTIPSSALYPPTALGLASGWEDGDPLGYADQVFIIREVDGPPVTSRRSETRRTGAYALRISGNSNSPYAYCYTKLFDEDLLIVPGTKLRYWIWHANTPKVAMDAHFTDGTDLRDLGLTDQNGAPFHPGQRSDPLGAWHYVEVDLSPVAGKTLDFVLVGYDNGSDGYMGPYLAYIDDFSIGPDGEAGGVPPGTPPGGGGGGGGSGTGSSGREGQEGCGCTGLEAILMLATAFVARRRK